MYTPNVNAQHSYPKQQQPSPHQQPSYTHQYRQPPSTPQQHRQPSTTSQQAHHPPSPSQQPHHHQTPYSQNQQHQTQQQQQYTQNKPQRDSNEQSLRPTLADPKLLNTHTHQDYYQSRHHDSHHDRNAHKPERLPLFPEGLVKRTLTYGALGFLAACTVGAASSIANTSAGKNLTSQIQNDADYHMLRTDESLCTSYRNLLKILGNIMPEYTHYLRSRLDHMIENYFDVLEFINMHQEQHQQPQDISHIHNYTFQVQSNITHNRLIISKLLRLVYNLTMAYNLFWTRIGNLLLMPEDEINVEAKIRVALSVMRYGVLPVAGDIKHKDQPTCVSYCSSLKKNNIVDSRLIVYEPENGVLDDYMVYFTPNGTRRSEAEVVEQRIIYAYNQMWMYLHLRWRPTMKHTREQLLKYDVLPKSLSEAIVTSYYSKLIKIVDQRVEKQNVNSSAPSSSSHKSTSEPSLSQLSPRMLRQKLASVELEIASQLKQKRKNAPKSMNPTINLYSSVTDKIKHFIGQARSNNIYQTILGNPYEQFNLHDSDASYLPTSVISILEFDTHATMIGKRCDEYGTVIYDQLRMLNYHRENQGPQYDFSSLSTTLESCKRMLFDSNTWQTKRSSSDSDDNDSSDNDQGWNSSESDAYIDSDEENDDQSMHSFSASHARPPSNFFDTLNKELSKLI